MTQNAKGKLIIVGGHENKKGDRPILETVAQEMRGRKGPLVLITVASQQPEALAEDYIKVFSELGIEKVEVLDIRERAEAYDEANVRKLDNAPVVFFTGGDQLRITSQIGDSFVYRTIWDLYQKGSTIVGTSAGAACMPETMLVSGPGDESNEVSALNMAPGLGLIRDVVIDSH
jgi:cyanophycinase